MGIAVLINGGRYDGKTRLVSAPGTTGEELPVEQYESGSIARAFVSGFNACLEEILK